MQRLPSPKGFQGKFALLSGAAQRDGGTGPGSKEVHCSFWNAPGDALWSSTKAL